MFRRWLSAFWRDNKEKIIQIAKVLGVLIGIGASAGIVFSNLNLTSDTPQNGVEIYKPKDVAISGGEISEEKFEKENSIVEEFVEFCNAQNSTEAYNLLTKKCKEKLYPTLQDFENEYYKMIFTEKREYNIQAWVTASNYSTYRIRYTQDFMATGIYEGTEKYEDYITIVTDGENKKININGYVKTDEINEQTKTDELEIEVSSVDTYMNYVVYNINLKNITDNDILLDNLESTDNIKLIGSNGATYKLDSANLKMFDLRISANGKKQITLTFRKTYGSDVSGNSIKFSKSITNYTEYRKNKEEYVDFKEITIKL